MSCDAEVGAVLRSRGLRRTLQRTSILATLRHAEGHLTAAQVHAGLEAKTALSTVYRTLEGLCEAGVVSALEGAHGTTFEWAGDEDDASHHHLRCLRCGSVTEIELPRLARVEAEIRARTGFDAQIRHLGIAGLCRACRQGSAS